jgi:hypothetical protein
MELAISLVGLGGLYLISNQNKNPVPFNSIEKFTSDGRGRAVNALPNINIPDKNYPTENATQNTAYDRTSTLSTVNQYGDGLGSGVFTDKYYQTGAGAGGVAVQEYKSQYKSLTGDLVSIDKFAHNNMVPFFGSNVRGKTGDSNRYESTLDNYTGAGSQIIRKVEQSPLFKPSDHTQHAYGAPNMNDFYQSRAGQNLNAMMQGVKPFDSISVGPGLGGDGTSGSGGFNSGMEHRETWLPKTADQLRVQSNPKASEYGLLGLEGAPRHFVTQAGDVASMGQMNKNRPDTAFEINSDRYFTTTGAQKNQPMPVEIIDRHTSRQETTVDYQGIAKGANDGTYTKGEYMPSHNIELPAAPVPHATAPGKTGAREGDYSLRSNVSYNNNRTQNNPTAGGANYFGGVGGLVGAIIAPILDVLRPTRNENTIGAARPYGGNPGSSVESKYLFNPSDILPPTIRQTTERAKEHYQINRNQEGGGYLVNPQTAEITNRMTTTTEYSGGANRNNVAQTSNEANYNQRNNDLKSLTIDGYTPNGGMNIFQADTHYTVASDRSPVLPVGAADYGATNGFSKSLVSNIQYERNQPEVMGNILKKNPYVSSYYGM